jgi:hypothetical protein
MKRLPASEIVACLGLVLTPTVLRDFGLAIPADIDGPPLS